ncbi:nucleotide disphospho-sugar-binding domain-containing protein [Amycolatopsis rhabdoformis]|uniref:Nucleotide disphospho-sugar-binding domain-containing protein n=1 Tax=Amycolatopsis rhabdoformis TaxID=1448059 RepID=A0ABZ1HY07_9PSEU|nr:nucleotide disphospho-sugar-binding domain-containing protein [Amycolatopsis rhabdoformis]WSE26411.1 nucleotide disphospho-sugar-binding domain-containing protein [Amycolatopsis rhabdoformis]
MRVLLAVTSSAARLRTLVPLAWALRTAGHDVKIAGKPDFTGEILTTGCVAAELDLAEFAALWRPDVVVSDGEAAGTAAANSVGAKAVRVLGPLDSPPADASELLLDLVPPSLRDKDSSARPMRHVPYFGPSEVPTWLRRKARRPRVLLSITNPEFYEVVFAEASAVDFELICAGTPPVGVSLPASVKLVDSAPPAAVLPTCAAVAHDGDDELTLAALAHGVPQLSLVETPLATRVAAAGAGVIGWLSSVVSDPQLRAGALAVRDEMVALPAPRDIVAELTR